MILNGLNLPTRGNYGGSVPIVELPYEYHPRLPDNDDRTYQKELRLSRR
jgi:hypothetical protein